MSFRTVWGFTAIIMVCVIAEMVEAQYRVPIYYRIARRMDGDNQGVNDVLLDNCPTCESIMGNADKRSEDVITLGRCTGDSCRPIPKIHEKNQPENDNRSVSLGNVQSRPMARNGERSRYENENGGYELIQRRSPKPSSRRLQDNEDKGNWNEKQAIIQQFLLKSWTEWNRKSERGNGKEELNQ